MCLHARVSRPDRAKDASGISGVAQPDYAATGRNKR
jgi:hypothetical protein